jgi:uncharacterized membrane protein YqaE (UPF0057 family)
MKKFTLLSLVAVLILAACTVEKRIYRNGYNVQWHSSLKVKNQTNEPKVAEEVMASQQTNDAATQKVSIAQKEQDLPTLAAQKIQQDFSHSALKTEKVQKDAAQLAGVVKQYFVKETTSKAAMQENKVVKHQAKKLTRQLNKAANNYPDEVPYIVLFILCFIFPPIVVGLVTNWDTEIIIYNLLWCVLCGFPGIIHALIILGRYR